MMDRSVSVAQVMKRLLGMKKDIVLTPGALASPRLWHYQETYLQASARLYYLDVLDSQSIPEMATRFLKKAPEKFILIGFSMGGYI